MKRIEKKALYDIISQCKTGAMEKETLKQFVLMRLELRKFYEEFEQARTAFSEDTKPDGWKDGDDVAERNNACYTAIRNITGEFYRNLL